MRCSSLVFRARILLLAVILTGFAAQASKTTAWAACGDAMSSIGDGVYSVPVYSNGDKTGTNVGCNGTGPFGKQYVAEEFCRRFYSHLGLSTSSWTALPKNWKTAGENWGFLYTENDVGSVSNYGLLFGDILCFPTPTEFGHVAMVVHVEYNDDWTPVRVWVLQQNKTNAYRAYDVTNGKIGGGCTGWLSWDDDFPDLDPPAISVTPPENPDGWYNTPQAITWSITEPKTGIRLAKIYDDTDEGYLLAHIDPACTKSVIQGSTQMKEGEYTLTIYAEDGAGDWQDDGALTEATYRLDTHKPPTNLCSVTILDDGLGITASKVVELELAGEDWDDPKNRIDGSGVTSVRVSNDPNSWPEAWEECGGYRLMAWTLPSGDGPKTVYAQFRDEAGNVSETVSGSIILDETPPVTSISQIPQADPQTGWARSDVTISLRAVDAISGVDATYYQIDGGEVAYYFEPFPIDEGAHTINYWSEDSVGNVESHKSLTVKVDTDAPVTSISQSPPPNPQTGWAQSVVTVTVGAQDSASGVAARYYLIDGGTEEAYSVPLQIGNGSHVIFYWSKDAAGNVEGKKMVEVKVDTEQPSSTTVEIPPQSGCEDTLVAVLNASDIVSGVKDYHYAIGTAPDTDDILRWTDGGPVVYRTGLSLQRDVTYYLTAYACDVAGNCGPKGTGQTTVVAAMSSAVSLTNSGGVSAGVEPDCVRSSTNFLMVDSVGQLAVGESESTSYAAQHGYWNTAAVGLPTILTHPEDLMVCLECPFTFFVRAMGAPPLRYQWRRDGLDIDGAIGAAFAATSTAIPESAIYDCVVTNHVGSVVSDSARLVTGSCLTLLAARDAPDGPLDVVVRDGAVTCSYPPDFFYIEDLNRLGGLLVVAPNHHVRAGDTVDIAGTVGTQPTGERYIDANLLIETEQTAWLEPFVMSNRSLGGGANPLGVGQPGVLGGHGLNNIGLSVRIFGKVTAIGPDYVYIDDGTHLRDGTTTDDRPNVGVRVVGIDLDYPLGYYADVTGISTCFRTPAGAVARCLLLQFPGGYGSAP